ncbi:c-type cytochrome domain-containing protein [Aquimarina latercula]|uniref:c-type cytochrome domain-containing protein n=1 Tax=Aquimarina latercula TaxID=987 RepID=UPI000405FBBE|nr:c-type cytochrome domain-containing protein [Aquimarina latercula]
MNEVSDFVLFFGRFHPLVVHLPIGFLFFAFILEIVAKYQKKELLKEAVPLALFFGAFSAIIACVLGYMLSLSGDYEGEALDKHFWFGIATTVIAVLACVLKTKRARNIVRESVRLNIATLTFIVLLLNITGHYGGHLTHGSDYLTAYLPFSEKENKEALNINSIEEAQLFAHVVHPILDNKCLSCHNSSKKKGGLSFADQVSILNGGKSGVALVAGNSDQSELIKRVHLDPDDKEFMPPEGKTPLTKEEIKIIEYWIDNCQADFTATIGTVDTPEEIKKLLIEQLQFGDDHSAGAMMSVASPVSKEIIVSLLQKGVNIREIVSETNRYDVSILPKNTKELDAEVVNEILEELSKIKDNIVWLSLPSQGISDTDLKVIGSFRGLQKLALQQNNISDIGIQYLTSLEQLESINLHSNSLITNKSIEHISKFKKLVKIYLWNTSVKKEDSINKKVVL